MTPFSKIIKKAYLPAIGLLALTWFLVRVIPKPTRALYPCQRAAFPLATSFIIWLMGISITWLSFKKARRLFARSKLFYSGAWLIIAVFMMIGSGLQLPGKLLFGNDGKIATAKLTQVPVILEKLDEPVVTPSATVSVIQSDKAYASDITFNEVLSMVRNATKKSGGLEGIIENGDVVILKPNLVSLPETWLDEFTEVNGKTTDWRVTRAVAILVRELNPDGRIIVMEGSAANSTGEVMETLQYDAEHIPEVNEFLSIEEISGNYKDIGSDLLAEKFLHPDNRLYPVNLMPDQSLVYYFNKQYFEADVLISIPVLKNHDAASFTGSIKNVGIGATPTSIYGNSSSSNGRWEVISHEPSRLHQWIHDYYCCRPVDFVVIDGLQGMEYGPTEREYQTERKLKSLQKNMRLIIAGSNAVATDAIAALVMEQDPALVNHLAHLHNSGLGTINTALIRINGEAVNSVRKTFDHWSENALLTMFDDLTPPSFEVNSCSVKDGKLIIDLSADEDVAKVEVRVNGQLLSQIAIDRYDSIVMDLDTLSPAENSDIVIYAYDRFLNSTSRNAENTDVTGIDSAEPSVSISLAQNYPNPFFGSTTIPFNLSSPGDVSLKIFDLSGREIVTLVNEFLYEGNHSVAWNSGPVPGGIYIYSLKVNGQKISRLMVVR